MKRRRFGRIGLVAAVVLAVTIGGRDAAPAGWPRVAWARAQEPTAVVWEPTGLTGPVAVQRLFTPASGALFARSGRFFELYGSGLLRSDDGGATWRPVLPPDGGAIVAVDPTDHTTLYATGQEGLYKSADDAVTWSLVLPKGGGILGNAAARILDVAISTADRNLVYLPVATGSAGHFLRSRDGGASWESLAGPLRGDFCDWSVLLLEPHPTDPARAFRTWGCFAGRDTLNGAGLAHSTDQGASWSRLFFEQGAFPWRLVGGQGSAPGRFYLAASHRTVAGEASGGVLYRSDDDGASWALVFSAPENPNGPGGEPTPRSPVGGLAYDPSAPERVYVGLFGTRPEMQVGVIASADGGATWGPAGQGQIGSVYDLALGVDGLNLYAATEQGVWRLPLGP